MPYVNCPRCGIRSFALAPWSAVATCPACEAPLALPRVAGSPVPARRPSSLGENRAGTGGSDGGDQRSGLPS